MSRTFQDTLEYDATNVMLNADEFGTGIVHTSPESGPEDVVGVVDYDSLDAGMPPVTDEKGTRIKQRAILELPISVDVTEEQTGGKYPSTFTIAGQAWLAKRIIGQDEGTQSVEIVRTDQKATKRAGK